MHVHEHIQCVHSSRESLEENSALTHNSLLKGYPKDIVDESMRENNTMMFL